MDTALFQRNKIFMTIKSILHRLNTPLQLFSREDIGVREKVKLILSFIKILILNRLFKRSRVVKFLNYKVEFLSQSNLEGILEEIFLRGDYSINLRNNSPVIVDCGGNIGVSVIFFKHYYPDSKITVFEASKKTFDILKRNVEINSLKDVSFLNVAVADRKGKIDFWDNVKNPGGSTSSEEVYYSKSISNEYVKETVSSELLSDYINGRVDLLKIDIEGGEGLVIRDLDSKDKLNNIREIIFEYHYDLNNNQNNFTEIIKILEKNKFKIIIFNNEFGFSSELLKKRQSYHFMVRAHKDDK